jgi:hypothetical protein
MQSSALGHILKYVSKPTEQSAAASRWRVRWNRNHGKMTISQISQRRSRPQCGRTHDFHEKVNKEKMSLGPLPSYTGIPEFTVWLARAKTVCKALTATLRHDWLSDALVSRAMPSAVRYRLELTVHGAMCEWNPPKEFEWFICAHFVTTGAQGPFCD